MKNKYNILIIRNKLGTIKVEDDMEKVIAYFKARTPLEIVVDYIDVDFKDLEHIVFLNKLGHDWYGLKDTKARIRTLNIVPDNKYHTVMFVYDGLSTKGGQEGKYITSWSFYGEMVPGTEYIEIATNTAWDSIGDMYRVITHELIHAFVKRIARKGRIVKDELDQTIVNGKIEYYFKEFDIEATDGNRQLTLNNLKPFWDIVVQQAPVVVVKKTRTPYRPPNFTLRELVSKRTLDKYGEKAWEFLDERATRNLQFIRDNLGPTIVNTPIYQYRGFDAIEFRKSGYSQHNMGRGFDYIVRGMTAEQVRKWVIENQNRFPEPNMWIEVIDTHNHIDVRYSTKEGVYPFNPTESVD